MNAFDRSTLRLAGVNLALVAAAGMIMWLQWREMRSGSNDTRKVADAATSGAAVNREALDSVQRAFISFTGMDTGIPPLNIPPAPLLPEIVGFSPSFENSGTTTARGTRMFRWYSDLPDDALWTRSGTLRGMLLSFSYTSRRLHLIRKLERSEPIGKHARMATTAQMKTAETTTSS